MCSFRGPFANRGNGAQRVSSEMKKIRNRSPTQRVRFREEEGRSVCAVFAALSQTAETERSEFLLTISGCSAVGSAGALGASGRWFKSSHSDQKSSEISDFRGFLLFLCLLRRK